MHTKTIRPGLTAAMTAGRHLLAAGWVYDSTTPMADDTTIRTLLHPSGREIHARTDDRDGDTTALTMTGLSLEQVAGAIAGAGLGEPATDAPQTREIKARYLKAGMTVIDGTDGPLVVTIVDRDGDVVLVSFEGVPEWTQYAPEVGVTVVDGRTGEVVEPDLRHRLAAELHRIADDIVTQQLPLGRIMSASLSVGVLDSRADVERWAAYLGSAVQVDSNGIPYTEGQVPLGEKYGPSLTVGAQARQEHPSELERLRARNAELEAQLAEGGAVR